MWAAFEKFFVAECIWSHDFFQKNYFVALFREILIFLDSIFRWISALADLKSSKRACEYVIFKFSLFIFEKFTG